MPDELGSPVLSVVGVALHLMEDSDVGAVGSFESLDFELHPTTSRRSNN